MHQARTLKFQIAAALLGLLVLSTVAVLHSQQVLHRQHADDIVLRLGGQLQLTHQNIEMQAMNYAMNAPRDYPSYYRDLRLYYRDLASNRDRCSAIVHAFASGRFPPELTGMESAVDGLLDAETAVRAAELAGIWDGFASALEERLGPDVEEPRLEWAADMISAESPGLERAIDAMLGALESGVTQRTQRATLVNRAVLVLALVLALGILAWFYRSVLRPLHRAADGLQRVATGDFGHRVEPGADNEIGWMIDAFNRLARRLDTLLQLITRLEQGSDLASTLAFVAEAMPPLLPLDWIGALVEGPDGKLYLEGAYRKGIPVNAGRLGFDPNDGALVTCLDSPSPVHFADATVAAQTGRGAGPLLQFLLGQQVQDVIVVPVHPAQGGRAAIVLGASAAGTYSPEHIRLLGNLATLISVSFARTLTLVESQRLAVIGQFTAGIVHEVRNPLATISLALEHLDARAGLTDDASRRRVALAMDEVGRMGRLLDDILLYAKPVQLRRSRVQLATLVGECAAALDPERARVRSSVSDEHVVDGDRDRLRQVILNLLRNAIDAADPGTPVDVSCAVQDDRVLLTIANTGAPIPEAARDRLFEPFYTSKASGTGLGLPIVRRILDAHGATLELGSEPGRRTVARAGFAAAAAQTAGA